MFIEQKRKLNEAVVKRELLSNARLLEGHGREGLLSYQEKEHTKKKSTIYVARVK